LDDKKEARADGGRRFQKAQILSLHQSTSGFTYSIGMPATEKDTT